MNKMRRLLALLMTLAMLACVTPVLAAEETIDPINVPKMADVPQDAWCAEAVDFVVERGYMKGFTDGTFRINTPVTRGQLFQTLYQIQGSPKVEDKTSFADVSADAWYADAAAWAKGTGLTDGTAAGFSAGERITRQQLAKVLCAYADYTGVTLQGGDIAAFTDATQVAAYAQPYVKIAVGSGILRGTAEKKLNPAGNLTRGQLAQLLNNYFTRVEQTYTSEKRPLLLEGAMDIETTTMIAALSDTTAYTLGQWEYVAGTYCGYPVVVCRTEQGEANAAASTALAIAFFHPVAVINQGTSGGHDPALHTGDIVIGKQSFDGSSWKSDQEAKGAGADYQKIEMLGVYAYDKTQDTFVKKLYFDADATLLAAARAVKSSYTQGDVTEGIIDTSDSWNNQVDRMLFLYRTYGSSCEEMETNAVAQICQNGGVPFLGIRILSNTGIYGEDFDASTGPACQTYVLNVAKQYITGYLDTAPSSVTANPHPVTADDYATSIYDKTQRPVLIEGAMNAETTTMIAALSNTTSYQLGEWDYVAGTYHGYPVVICRTEQGLANAAAATALAIECFNPIAVINQGTSGGHAPDLHTGDIVIGERTVNYCAWRTAASAEGAGVDYKAFEMNGVYDYVLDQATFTKSVYHQGDATLLSAAAGAEYDNTADRAIVRRTIGTSNEWNCQIDRILYLNETVGTCSEDMETDAVAQIAQTYATPFLGIRILSDNAIYEEEFDIATGVPCQEYTLAVVAHYIDSNLK